MSEAGDLIDIKFLDEAPPDRERWEQAIRRAYGHAFGKARLERAGDGWRVKQALMQDPDLAQRSETLPAPRDARARVVAALREAGLPVRD